MTADQARALNLAAEFLPAEADDPDSQPAIRIAGALVFVYVDEYLALNMSADPLSADPEICFPECGCLRLVARVNSQEVFDTSDGDECY